MTKQQQSIEERINNALSTGSTSSATIVELIKETEVVIKQASATAEKEHARALDLTTPDPNAAAELARAAALKGDRLRPVIPRLREKLAEAITSELHGKWLSDFHRVEAERNQLAREFDDVYRRLTAQFVDLASRMMACAGECARVDAIASNQFDGEHRRLLDPEAYARAGASGPKILATVVLPSFDNSRTLLWPPKQPSVGAAFAASVMPSPAASYANRGEWWRDAEARTEQRRKEFQQVEGYYSKQHAETEERQNAEVRERIEADRAAKWATQRR